MLVFCKKKKTLLDTPHHKPAHATLQGTQKFISDQFYSHFQCPRIAFIVLEGQEEFLQTLMHVCTVCGVWCLSPSIESHFSEWVWSSPWPAFSHNCSMIFFFPFCQYVSISTGFLFFPVSPLSFYLFFFLLCFILLFYSFFFLFVIPGNWHRPWEPFKTFSVNL